MRAIFGLGSILMVVLILGIVSALSLGSSSAPPVDPTASSTTSPPSNAPTTTTRSITSQAEVVACESNAETLETAVGTYDAANLNPLPTESLGSGPGEIQLGKPTTYASATSAMMLIRGDYVSSWPSAADGYALSLSTTQAGAIEVYVPATARTATEFELETSTSGCNKL